MKIHATSPKVTQPLLAFKPVVVSFDNHVVDNGAKQHVVDVGTKQKP